MLEFNEVGRRIEQRNNGTDITHEQIISPIVGALLDPETYGPNGTFLTTHEGVSLGNTLLRQAQILDERERLLEEATEHLQQAGEFLEGHASALKRSLVTTVLRYLEPLLIGVLIGMQL
jgi:hypothetical protein